MPALDFVRRAEEDISVLASYACSDAAVFSACINPSEKIIVMDRLVRGSDRKAKGVGIVGGFQLGTDWNLDSLKNIYTRVRDSRYGECTTFAKSAAYTLSLLAGDKPRLEIVAFTNHVFIVVGRSVASQYVTTGVGIKKKQMLPKWGTTWGDDWVVVDPWAGAMGYPDIIYEFDGTYLIGINDGGDYPFEAMLDPISIVMHRPAGP
jgi:hypothetical protein